jgi:hypothetical protein
METLTANWLYVVIAGIVLVAVLYHKGYIGGSSGTVGIPMTTNPKLALYRRVKHAVNATNEEEAADQFFNFVRAYKPNPDEIRLTVQEPKTNVEPSAKG